MRIATCLKDVPARESRYQIRENRPWIHDSDLTFDISECDEYSLEESLKLKEKHGGEVIAVTATSDPARSEKSMRKALAMGADRGILIIDEAGELNSPYPTAAALAQVLRPENVDLVLVGTQSDDFGYGQTGVILAELLGIPHATIVMRIEVNPDANRVKALREMESGWFQWVDMSLPAVLAIQAGISQIRFAPLRGIMQARRKEIRHVQLSELGLELASMPRLEITDLYFQEVTSKAEILDGDVESVATTLVDRLRKEAKVL
jgi:electron transfer flavoprotein beta subunit